MCRDINSDKLGATREKCNFESFRLHHQDSLSACKEDVSIVNKREYEMAQKCYWVLQFA